MQLVSPPLPSNIGNPQNIETQGQGQVQRAPQQNVQQQQFPQQQQQQPPQQNRFMNNQNQQQQRQQFPQQQQQQNRVQQFQPQQQQQQNNFQQQQQGNFDNSNFTQIRNLSPYNQRWTIKARVTAKSEMKSWDNGRTAGRLFHIDLVDAQVCYNIIIIISSYDKIQIE